MGTDIGINQIVYQCIPGDENYKVGTDGSVWSCLELHGRGYGGGSYVIRGESWHQLKPSIGRDGYAKIILVNNGNRKYARVHKLVLETFVGPCPDGMECAHRNGIRVDNRRDNLRWATPKENAEDKEQHGTLRKGSTHYKSKLTDEQIIDIRIKSVLGVSSRSLAKEYKVSQWNIRRIILGETWKDIS